MNNLASVLNSLNRLN
jgi:tetratricopeptide (TPR) repeat protein